MEIKMSKNEYNVWIEQSRESTLRRTVSGDLRFVYVRASSRMSVSMEQPASSLFQKELEGPVSLFSPSTSQSSPPPSPVLSDPPGFDGDESQVSLGSFYADSLSSSHFSSNFPVSLSECSLPDEFMNEPDNPSFVPPAAIPPTITLEQFEGQLFEAVSGGHHGNKIFICSVKLRDFCDQRVTTSDAVRHGPCAHDLCKEKQNFLVKEAQKVGLLTASRKIGTARAASNLSVHLKAAQGVKLTSLHSLRLVKNLQADEFETLVKACRSKSYLETTRKCNKA
eukprot:g67969.t1